MNNRENIQLVKLVEQHKCLWDKFCNKYQNKEAMNAAWEIIAEDMGKAGKGSLCRSQWRNIRNTYLRSLQKSRGREYYLSQYMKFIQPQYEMGESSRTPTVSSMSSVSSSMSFDGGFMSSNTPLSRSYSSNSFTSFHSNCDEENTHMIFFQSLLPDLENMNDRQVRKFRRGILDLIDNVLQDDNITSPAGATIDFNNYRKQSGTDQVTSQQPMMIEQYDETEMINFLQELSTPSALAPAGGTTTVVSAHSNLNDNNQNMQGMLNSMPYMRQI